MGTRKFLTFTTLIDFVNRGFVNDVLNRNMFRVADSFRVFVSTLWILGFGIFSHIFSFKAGKCYQKNQYGWNDQTDTNYYKEGTKVEEFTQKEEGFQGDGEQVSHTGEKENSVVMERAMASSTSKYEFLSEKHISGFIEEPKSFIFSVQELNLGSNNSTDCHNGFLALGEVFDQKRAEDSIDKVLEKKEEKSILDSVMVCDEDKAEDSVVKVLKNQGEETFTGNESGVFTEFRFLPRHDLSNEVPRLSEECSLPFDSKLDTIGLINDFSMTNNNFELYSYEFLSERNFSEELETESVESISEEKVESTESILDQAISVMKDETFESDDEYIELEPESPSSSVWDEEIWSTENLIQAEEKQEEDLFHERTETAESHRRKSEESLLKSSNVNEAKDNNENFDLVYEYPVDSSVTFEEYSLEENEFISDSDDEDDDDLEFASEHDDIIEQLKMELKNARTGGLPTILEESESPLKMVEELKPLKIDYKLDYKDRMIEIHKFYRSYLDKMRKLDILNSQTMHAIGLLRLKRLSGQVINTQKSAVPVIKSLLSQTLWSCKPQRCEANPTLKLIGDLRKDFEVMYVGQLCLSWEILHWQYRKALELQEFDVQELRLYNQVAGDFQIFQVLLQRFMENEPFQSDARVQNYVNNRCVHCNLLQVPVIKDDSLKDKKGRRRDGEVAITSPMLTEIIEESMRVFWEFLRTDRAETDIILKGPELQDSIDSELLIDIRTDYQKKEKRLKEILRSCSCIVRKLQKHNKNRSNQAMLFAQVELKLISRVLTMSKLTTDQLVWCHEKLDQINFWNRKLVLEPSFLLFPC